MKKSVRKLAINSNDIRMYSSLFLHPLYAAFLTFPLNLCYQKVKKQHLPYKPVSCSLCKPAYKLC